MTFSDELIQWYLEHKRDLPFRGIRDPYRIWISEIILQQTRMDQGLAYYDRFIQRFPDLNALAMASEEEVLRLWQGLGYYSRARHLHAAAKRVEQQLNGRFPQTYAEIKKLPGIGDYTAASVASLAFLEPCPAIDGNVYRFFARYTALHEPVNSSPGKEKIREQLLLVMDKERPDLFNQAMIEYGALMCTPHHPRCDECFLQPSCEAFLQHIVSEIPVKKPATPVRIRYFYYLVVLFTHNRERYILLHKRSKQDIWKNMYEFPLIEMPSPTDLDQLGHTPTWKDLFRDAEPVVEHVSGLFRHLLSHQELRATFIRTELPGKPGSSFQALPVSQLDTLPLPRLITRYIEKEGISPVYFHIFDL